MTDAPHPSDSRSGLAARPESVFVAAIGASAGGLVAAEQFFGALPSDPGIAFVVVQHLAPDHESELAEILQAQTGLRVKQAVDGDALEKNCIYTIPPGHSMTAHDGQLTVRPVETDRSRVPASIDDFFRSLAYEAADRCAGIILSGTGTDGTTGLKAIKEAGGVTLVQSPKSAEYDGMPRSAVATGLADITGTPEELAVALIGFLDNSASIRIGDQEAELRNEGGASLGRILRKLHNRTGHDFSHYKRTSLLRRLERRLQLLQIADLPAYVAYVRENPPELDALLKDLLISVTNFFRDPDAWDVIEGIIPHLFEGKTVEDTVRVWVPGCATGEEAYSIAILLCEYASRQPDAPMVQVFATDIDENALLFARDGIYPEAVAKDIPRERLSRFFDRVGSSYRVSKSIRDIVLFAPHNLLRDAPFSRLDLVSCRNLLIYLNREIQETIFEIFHYALVSGGYLFLGGSETAENADRIFNPVDKRHRVYQRRDAPRNISQFPRIASASYSPQETPVVAPRPRRERSAADIHRERLLSEVVPATILVDEEYELIHMAGRAHRFLRDADGVPANNLLVKILPSMRLEVRAALFQAFQTEKAVHTRIVDVDLGGDAVEVEVDAIPLDESTYGGRFVELVLRLVRPAEEEGGHAVPVDRELASRLEEELNRTRENLRTVVEEYETANEELQASNEELQSMNEELRSTSEELETGREELQSMNEELITVNQELRSKIDELARANSDLNNLMGATEIGTIFVDRELRIKRYTPRAEDLFHLLPGDIGRPLRAFNQKLRGHDLVRLCEQVLRELTPIEQEQLSDDGQWFITRIRPYRTLDDSIDGVVLTFVDVTDLKLAERTAAFQAGVLAQVQDAVVAVDLDERIIYVNQSAAATFDIDPEQSIGKKLGTVIRIEYPTGNTKEDASAAVDLGIDWQGEVLYTLPSGRRMNIEARIARLEDEEGHRIGSIGVLRDITQRKQAESQVRERQEYLRTTLRNVPLITAITDTDLRYRWVYNAHPDFDPNQLVGKRDEEIDGEQGARLMQLKKEVLHFQKSVRRELSFERSDGSYIYDITADPIFAEDGTLVGVSTAALDVTRQRLHEEELWEAKQRAESANAAKAAFLAAVSHELRTPLNAIMGYVDLMELGVPDVLTEKQTEQIGRIRLSARHLLQVIEEILQFARVDAGRERSEIGRITLSDLIEEVQAVAEPLAAAKRLELRLSVEEAPPLLFSDPRKLRQVLLNLIGNAVKFTDEGRVELRIRAEEDEVLFQVIDTGQGMEPDEIENIFKPFWQSDSTLTRRQDGTGLGLAISRRYMDLLGGEISVQSSPGHGSVFSVRIPVIEPHGSADII